jgi:hypothetical protein
MYVKRAHIFIEGTRLFSYNHGNLTIKHGENPTVFLCLLGSDHNLLDDLDFFDKESSGDSTKKC